MRGIPRRWQGCSSCRVLGYRRTGTTRSGGCSPAGIEQVHNVLGVAIGRPQQAIRLGAVCVLQRHCADHCPGRPGRRGVVLAGWLGGGGAGGPGGAGLCPGRLALGRCPWDGPEHGWSVSALRGQHFPKGKPDARSAQGCGAGLRGRCGRAPPRLGPTGTKETRSPGCGCVHSSGRVRTLKLSWGVLTALCVGSGLIWLRQPALASLMNVHRQRAG